MAHIANVTSCNDIAFTNHGMSFEGFAGGFLLLHLPLPLPLPLQVGCLPSYCFSVSYSFNLLFPPNPPNKPYTYII
jgi:hypothetical protein